MVTFSRVLDKDCQFSSGEIWKCNFNIFGLMLEGMKDIDKEKDFSVQMSFQFLCSAETKMN